MSAQPNDPSRLPTEQTFASAISSDVRGHGPSEVEIRSQLLRRPRDTALLGQLATVVASQGRHAEAIELQRRAVDLAPDDSSLRFRLATMLNQQGDPENALGQLRQLRPPFRTSFEAQTTEAGLLGMLGRHYEQAEIYQKLLRRHPEDPRLWDRLGNALKYAGRSDAAIRALRRSVKLDPSFGDAWWSLANVKTYRFDPADIAAMKKALDGRPERKNAASLHFALGKALENIGEYQASFEHYAEGNRIRAADFTPEQMSASRLRHYVDETIATFDGALFDRLAERGHPSCEPIFVVGLQRSGSTLIEQILASHPMIEGVAEPDAMLHVWTAFESSATRLGKPVWDAIRELTPEQLHQIGADYLDRIRPFRKTDRPLFIDKRPANWMYVGLIRLALPNAKIIDARRHPMACCFSNFKQHYAAGHFPFSYSLETVGNYYAEYLRLMDFFDRLQPKVVHHALNERLIDDPEGQIRALLEFVRVAFDEACLHFHKNKRAVTTASAEQVRRPINREGVAQWLNYEPWLGPLKDALGSSLANWASPPIGAEPAG